MRTDSVQCARVITDGAAYYEAYVSGAPAAGFVMVDTATATSTVLVSESDVEH